MIKNTIHTILAVLVLLSSFSCTQQEQPYGAVTISLSSGLPETRGPAEVRDGSEIFLDGEGKPDLVLLIFKGNDLYAKYPSTTATVIGDEPDPKDLQIKFSNIEQGEYTVYALANTAGLWTMSGDPTSASITRDETEALYFTSLPIVPDPNSDTSRMPLTAKSTLSVNAIGNGNLSMTLTRPVARVVFQFVNSSGHTLKLQPFNAALKKMNPDRGYLFQHTPDTPAGTTYGDLTYNKASLDLAKDDVYEFVSLVYPGSESYLCDVSFSIAEVDGHELDNTSQHDFEYTDLKIYNNWGEDITSLARNQQLTVKVRVGVGLMLSFSFEVGGWTKETETVTFN